MAIMKRFSQAQMMFNDMIVPVGNFGIPRSSMPQIDGEWIHEYLAFLEDHGIEVEFKSVKVHSLKMTQSEINKDKVIALADVYKKKKKLNRVFVSKDGYVVDGTHRFIAQLNVDRQSMFRVIQIDMNILDIIRISKHFSRVKFRKASDNKLDKSKSAKSERKQKNLDLEIDKAVKTDFQSFKK